MSRFRVIFFALWGAVLGCAGHAADSEDDPQIPQLQNLNFDQITPLKAITGIDLPPTERIRPGESFRKLSAFGMECSRSVDVTKETTDTVELLVSAPCQPFEKIEILQDDIGFSLNLPITGTVELSVPKIARAKLIFVRFWEAETRKIAFTKGVLSDEAQIALEWNSPDHPSLVVRGTTDAQAPTIGKIVNDGDRALTVLSGLNLPQSLGGVLRLELQRKVTLSNCKSAATGHVFRHDVGMPPVRYDISIAPADCALVGNTQVLKNILQDLTIAGK